MRYHEPVPDHAQTALEASCGALIAMESIRARMCEPTPEIEAALALATQAIAELRQAIKELRLAREKLTARQLPSGFVLAAGSE